jgi:hypothetical protein
MSNLRAFLAENAVQVESTKFIASKRFIGEDGTPIPWEIGCITSSEDEVLRKGATKRVPVAGKRNQFNQELDVNLYLGRLAAKCTLYPNLDDAQLQNSYGAMGADALLKAMLTPGEYADYLLQVQEVNGFDTTFEDEVDEAKN